jgi:hypothetical protein
MVHVFEEWLHRSPGARFHDRYSEREETRSRMALLLKQVESRHAEKTP